MNTLIHTFRGYVLPGSSGVNLLYISRILLFPSSCRLANKQASKQAACRLLGNGFLEALCTCSHTRLWPVPKRSASCLLACLLVSKSELMSACTIDNIVDLRSTWTYLPILNQLFDVDDEDEEDKEWRAREFREIEVYPTSCTAPPRAHLFYFLNNNLTP